MADQEKRFKKLVSNEKTDTVEKNRKRIKNRARLRESQQIAIKVLSKLRTLGWSQRDLATAMEVSPQQISKIVKGKENLTLETQVKLQEILDIPILATYYEKQNTHGVKMTAQLQKEYYIYPLLVNVEMAYQKQYKRSHRIFNSSYYTT